MGYLVTFYFIALDFFTGLLKAFATDAFSSRTMRQGLFHKVSLLCVLALGFLMDYAQNYVDLGVTVPVGAAACVYIVLMECGSIIENVCQADPELMPNKLCEMFGVRLSEQKTTILKKTEQMEKAKALPMEEETAETEEAKQSENQ